MLVNNHQSYGYGEDQENESKHRDNYEHNYDTEWFNEKDREQNPYIVNPI